MNRRLAGLREFVLEHVGAPPAALLEIGAGEGELALALAEARHAVTAIDPRAPEGPIFRRMRLEDFAEPGPFDAVVASLSLHHVHDLDAALDRVGSLLRPGGVLCLDEFAKENLAGRTARWYYHQREALAAVGRGEAAVRDGFDAWHREWVEEHAEIHTGAALREALTGRFVERFFEWVPYLYSYRLDDALEPLERALIESGEILATGFRYVGVRGPR